MLRLVDAVLDLTTGHVRAHRALKHLLLHVEGPHVVGHLPLLYITVGTEGTLVRGLLTVRAVSQALDVVEGVVRRLDGGADRRHRVTDGLRVALVPRRGPLLHLVVI